MMGQPPGDLEDPPRWSEGGVESGVESGVSGVESGFEAPQELSALLRDELQRGQATVQLGGQEARLQAILQGVGAQVGRPELGQTPLAQPVTASSWLGGSGAKLGAALGVLALLGAGLWLARGGERDATFPAAAETPAPPTALQAAVPKLPEPEPTLAAPEPTQAQVPEPAEIEPARAELQKRTRPARRPAPPPDPAAELALLEQAQRAMASSPGRTLSLAQEHKKLYRHGQFQQEREMLAIEALLRLGEQRNAELRGRRFEKAFPRSSHVPRLRQLLASDHGPR
ncbi:MAG: hypothetical protein OEZ06_06765 [Myxococcales bacterium]|nr:hypothetical protein [Myxococcales bacterium]